jgi:predicted RNase H-like HicB family nuclease
VIYHHEVEGWWAESPDIDGWSAAGDSYERTRALAEEGVRFALDRDQVTVEHYVPADELRPAQTAGS